MDDTARTHDGRALHLERHGDGAPVVVFESGMGASRSMWGAVVPLVAARTSAVVYDRSGLGRSEVDDAPRTLARLADDLGAVLDHIGPGPFVLVGHSWGGPIARVAAAAVPARIAGLVLVDQTDERCELFFSTAARRQASWSMRTMPVLARTGLLRLPVRKLAAHLPDEAARAMRAEDATGPALRTMGAELRQSLADLARLRDAPPTLPDVPVTFITGTKASRLEARRRAALLAAHRAHAGSLPRGRHVTADRSSHYVPFTEPELVADEVLRIVERERA
jgi:pimeloyl-ACP methyl ester carboxylesterase